MITIRSYCIKNYRSLVETDVEFNPNLTALVGTNGAGKTNLLNALLILKKLAHEGHKYRRYKADYQESNAPHSLIESEIIINNDKFFLKADVYFDTAEDNDSIKYAQLFIKSSSDKPNKWVELLPDVFEFIDFYKSRKGEISHSLAERYLTKSKIIKNALLEISDYLQGFSYYSATQFSDPTKSPISLELENNKLTRSHTSGTRTHEKFLFDLFTKYSNDKTAYRRYINTVGKEGLKLVDAIQFDSPVVSSTSIKVQSGGHIKKISTKRTFVIPSFTVDDLQLSPNQLSEGTFKTLALIFYILNDASKLLLIEEPEVCVHHGLLGDVIDLIKIQSKQKQIVISTHSDYVLDKLKPENIVVVRKSNQGTKAEPLDKAIPHEDLESLKIYLNETGNLGEYWKESGYFSDES